MIYDPPPARAVQAVSGPSQGKEWVKRRESAAQAALAAASEGGPGIYACWGWRYLCSQDDQGLWRAEEV